MIENFRKNGITIIFVGVVIWAIFYFLPDNTDKLKKDNASLETIQALTDKTTVKTDVIDIEIKSNESWGRDPFTNSVKEIKTSHTVKKEHKLWKLSGIIHNNSTPLAIINMRPVKVGDLIDDAKVININKNDVVLDYNGSKIVLNISKG